MAITKFSINAIVAGAGFRTERLDPPGGDWSWTRETRLKLHRKTLVPAPHVCFNDVAIYITPSESAVLEALENNPGGVTIDDLVGLTKFSTHSSAAATVSKIRKRMSQAFNQDLLTGSAGASMSGQTPRGGAAYNSVRLSYVRK